MLEFAHNALIYTLPFLLVLTVVVTVHEFGHFIVARACGVAVDRFSIGFGRAVLSWRNKAGMEWRVGWLPLGGYVKFSGDESIASVPDAEDLKSLRAQVLAREGPAALRRYFHFKPLWQRALVVAAGPVANFILTIAIFAILAMARGVEDYSPRIGDVMRNSPAELAGFNKGDLVLRADGRAIGVFSDLRRQVSARAGEPMQFDVKRGSQIVHLVATPARKTSADAVGVPVGQGYLGLGPSQSENDILLTRLYPLEALDYGVEQTKDILSITAVHLGRILTGQESANQLSGIIGMAGATGQATTQVTDHAPNLMVGARQLVILLAEITALISVTVGFANLLPIPVLDGGHLLFYGYEAVVRRPIAAKVQDAGYRLGFVLIISLVLFVAWNDLQRFRVFHFISGLFS